MLQESRALVIRAAHCTASFQDSCSRSLSKIHWYNSLLVFVNFRNLSLLFIITGFMLQVPFQDSLIFLFITFHYFSLLFITFQHTGVHALVPFPRLHFMFQIPLKFIDSPFYHFSLLFITFHYSGVHGPYSVSISLTNSIDTHFHYFCTCSQKSTNCLSLVWMTTELNVFCKVWRYFGWVVYYLFSLTDFEKRHFPR